VADQYQEYLFTQSIVAESEAHTLLVENNRLKEYISTLEKQLLDTMSVLVDIYNNKYP